MDLDRARAGQYVPHGLGLSSSPFTDANPGNLLAHTLMSDDHPKTDLEDLDSRLKRVRKKGKFGNSGGFDNGTGEASGFSLAMRVGAEMVSALIVGVGIGLLLDYWLDTGPWFFVVFFFLGAGAGMLNVYRATSNMGLAPGYRHDIEDK